MIACLSCCFDDGAEASVQEGMRGARGVKRRM